LKIFVTSLHRCGTQSMDLFLQQSGFRTCHWPAHYNQIDYQSRVADLEDQPDRVVDILRPMLEVFDAFSDVPIPAIYPTLDKTYPGSKFIAAYRNPFDWYRSVRRHCA
jgi:Sulfotransferase domain